MGWCGVVWCGVGWCGGVVGDVVVWWWRWCGSGDGVMELV